MGVVCEPGLAVQVLGVWEGMSRIPDLLNLQLELFVKALGIPPNVLHGGWVFVRWRNDFVYLRHYSSMLLWRVQLTTCKMATTGAEISAG